MADTNVVVVGAGVIGAACAWRLAQAGLHVTLLERATPGAGASRAALGVLQYHAKPQAVPAYQQLSFHSRALYPALLDELKRVTGLTVPYTAGGQLNLALVEEDWPELEALRAANEALGLAVERLSAEDCWRLEPGLTPRTLGGLYFPDDAWVDNLALTQALAKAAEQTGAKLVRAKVTRIEHTDGRASGVVTEGQVYGMDADGKVGPQPADGLTYPADWVVLAAGCWSSQVGGLPTLRVQPVRGQALAVVGSPVQRVVASARGYLAPKTHAGTTLVGATVEHAGYHQANTVGGLAEVLAAGVEIAPGLADSEFAEAWAGLRPATPDGLPYLGAFEELPNVIVAAGHFRNGILQAPATAEIVCALVMGGALPFEVGALRPGR